MKKLYKLADEVFEIEHLLETTVDYMKDYEVFNIAPKYQIKYTMDDLKEYKKKHKKSFRRLGIEEIDNSFIYGKVGNLLTLNNKFIIHGSSIYLDSLDNGYLFTAPSGTGKSTHSRLLVKMYGDRVHYINDDKPFIANNNGVFNIYGGPWNGKARISNNVKCDLKGIFIVERGHDNKARRIDSSTAVKYLIKQLFLPTGKEESKNALKCLIDLCMHVPVYILNVDMSDDAPKASYEIMDKKGDNKNED